ncbi:MAG: hypothetical protein HY074_16635 [Deltaproteobacteria bacterium]|nr:hypothetical protein [Deltaproteobacteria bacterium]
MAFTITKNSNGLFTYGYSVTNPSTNDGAIFSIDIFIGRDPVSDVDLPSTGFTHCKIADETNPNGFQGKYFAVPVGSTAPDKWSCGYGHLAGYAPAVFGWGSIDAPYRIKPGTSLSGFTLNSYGVPAIQDVLMEPAIDQDNLPPEYQENLKKIVALEKKVKWMGKTVGPKAPPKVFDGGNFIANLIALVNQSRAQGWIDNDGIVTSLLAKLNTAQSKLPSDTKTAKNTLSAFMNEVSAQNGKHLTSEAYALLYFNAQYAVNHL